MTSWMKERDRLVEQTLAFVKGVAAQRPIKTTVPDALPTPTLGISSIETDAREAPSAKTDALLSLALPKTARDRDEPILALEPIATAEEAQPIRISVKPSTYQPAIQQSMNVALPERDVIAQRVARFRAGQQKLSQDRENNYIAVQAKIRASLGNDPAV